MITRAKEIDLGHDKGRIRDVRDKHRQEQTVDKLLARFFNPVTAERMSLQILADEVGMGKTFVALAAAYSLLRAMRTENDPDADLQGCYQRVLVVTPANDALFTKWQNETGEFVKRCVTEDADEAKRWFAPVAVKRIDELSAELRKRGPQPRVLVTTMGMFSGGKVQHYELKRKLVLAALFRYWGNKLNYDLRANVLKGAPIGWPSNPEELQLFYPWEWDLLPFTNDETRNAIEELDLRGSEDVRKAITATLQLCRDIGEPYRRERDATFAQLERHLNDIYKHIAATLILQAFPLVIVDEAHNWKNGPGKNANGYRQFCDYIAGRTRRILLLTATPFQLRPDEMIEILKVGDALMPLPSKRASAERCEQSHIHREQVLRTVLDRSAKASRTFARSWAVVSRRGKSKDIGDHWALPDLVDARRFLQTAADAPGTTPEDLISRVAIEAMRGVDPEWRPFLKDALRLHAYNADLSAELGAVMIRHRRTTGHRSVRVGAEFEKQELGPLDRPDAHLLHGAPGIDVHGDGELAHYFLMRCVTELKKTMGKTGRSSLGNDLTGCYTTLKNSAEGKKIGTLLERSPVGARYLKLLNGMVNKDSDRKHPKIIPVVEQVVANWRRGEKTLLFCFRVNTAERLADILEERIRAELNQRQSECLGGRGGLDFLKKRLTSRTMDLITVGLDRVLWSLVVWQGTRLCAEPKITPADLELSDEDLRELARISLRHGVPVRGEHVDRVFLTRATEHLLAVRLMKRRWPRCIARVLKEVSAPGWVTHPYGLHSGNQDDAAVGEQAEFDERGVHQVYESGNDEPNETRIDELWAELKATREKARHSDNIPVLDVYAKGPNLWLGAHPAEFRANLPFDLDGLQKHLWSLTDLLSLEKPLSWESRRKVMQALRRAVLKTSVLARLLPTRAEMEESSWGVLLVESFLARMEGQRESFADRLSVFLEDLDAAGGDLAAADPSQRGMRTSIYDSTRLTDKFVALVKGGGGSTTLEQRTRFFTGFNTPLLPEVLVCTQVGQEGIDLHRHCRHVIHYDLAWNPAVLEQRTGRTDRIGSKTFREIERAKGTGEKPKLEVGVPYLAATYDERMYEELRLRAQAFEVLTGGDFSSDNPEGNDDQKGAEGRESAMRLIPLPPEMTEDLRVDLQVYKDAPT